MMGASSRNAVIVRGFRLLRMLHSADGLSVKEMAYEVGACVRTIYRYLDAMREAGVELERRDGRWRVER